MPKLNSTNRKWVRTVVPEHIHSACTYIASRAGWTIQDMYSAIIIRALSGKHPEDIYRQMADEAGWTVTPLEGENDEDYSR